MSSTQNGGTSFEESSWLPSQSVQWCMVKDRGMDLTNLPWAGYAEKRCQVHRTNLAASHSAPARRSFCSQWQTKRLYLLDFKEKFRVGVLSQNLPRG